MPQQPGKYLMSQSRVAYPRRPLPPVPRPRARSAPRRGGLPHSLHVESLLRLFLAGVVVLMLLQVLNQEFKTLLDALPFH
jgi:hypothetical protein